jgi:hypothetical protein
MATATDHIRRLGQALEAERPKLQKFDRYYSSSQPLSFLSPEVKAASGNRLQALSIPWPRRLVGMTLERLEVVGFRLEPPLPPDEALWQIWQQNNLDEGSEQAHEESMVHGRSYAIVWADDDGSPLITIESALQVIVEYRVGTRRRLRALKQWTDDGWAFATLYEPDQITRWRSESRAPDVVDVASVPADGWRLIEPIDNPLHVVPVVPLTNRGRLLEPLGHSELSDVLPVIDSIVKLATDMMTSAEFSALPRRWATGVQLQEEPVVDESTGEPTGETKLVNPFSDQAGRTWIAEEEGVKFGQFTETALEGYVRGIELLTWQLASVTGLPPHYFGLTKGQFPSAEGIRAAEAPLVQAAERKQKSLSGSWEEVMRLAVAVRDGHPPVGMEDLETVWASAETRTPAQTADWALKLVQGGIVPAEATWEALGFTPAQQQGMRTARRAEALDRAAVDLSKVVP